MKKTKSNVKSLFSVNCGKWDIMSLRFPILHSTIILLFFSTFSYATPQKDTLIFGSDQFFPPYEYINEKGEPEGFNIDIISELAREMNVEIVVKLGDWTKIRKELEVDGTVDFSDMFYGELRDSVVDYAFPHDIIYNKVYLHKSFPPILDISELNGKKVAVLRGSVLEDYLRTKFPAINLLPQATESDALQMVSEKICDAAIVTSASGNELLNESKIGNVVGYGNMILPSEYCFVVKEGNVELLKKINLALANLIANGTIEKLRKKWFEVRIFGIRQNFIKLGIAVLLLSLLLSYLLNFSLNSRIRKRNKQLLLSEDRWKFALEGPGDGLWDWNMETNEVYFSPQWKKMLGYSDTEIENKFEEWNKRVHPEDKQQVYENLNNHIEGKTPYFVCEYRVLCRDGKYIWILDRGKIMELNAEGKPRRVIGTHSDISERKKAEKALRDSEEKFRKAFKTSPDSINLNRFSDGTYLEINKGFERTIGYTGEEIIGKSSVKLNIWKNQTDREKLLKVLEEHGFVENLEAEFISKNGKILTGLMSASIIEVNNEKAVLSITRNITERKIIETKLIENEERFRTIFEQSASGMCLTNMEGKLIKVNSTLCEMLSYPREELVGKHFNSITYPDDLTIGAATIEQIMNGEIKKAVYEKRYLKKSGELIWIHVSTALLHDKHNNPKYFITQMEDITPRIEGDLALKSSENKFKALVEQSLTGIYILNKERFIYVNKRFCGIFGYSEQEILALKPTDLFEIEDRKIVIHKIDKRFSGKLQSIQYTVKGKHKLGKLLWVQIHGSHINLNDDEVITGTLLDISESIIAEEEIRKLNNELENKVKERTSELEMKVTEIQRLNNLFVGRELRMKELKGKLKELENRLNEKSNN